MASPTAFQVLHLSDLHLATTHTIRAAASIYGSLCAAIQEAPARFRDILAQVLIPSPNEEIRQTLKQDLQRATAEDERYAGPIYTIISGDICFWPYRQASLDRLYEYVCGDLDGCGLEIRERHASLITGNHDHWSKRSRNYEGSRFHPAFHVQSDNVDFAGYRGLNTAIFTLRTVHPVPPVGFLGPGEIELDQLDMLRRRLESLERGDRYLPSVSGVARRNPLSRQTYEDAIKILVIHHSPFGEEKYPQMSPLKYWLLKLRNEAFVEFCRSRIDLILCGHMHHAKVEPEMGVLIVNAGTCMAENPFSPRVGQEYNFQILRFHSTRSLTVNQYFHVHHGAGSPLWSRGSRAFEKTAAGWQEAEET